jgi:hypothetical protein
VIPDIEVLRVYLILPLYHEFLQPKFFEELHFPFACVLLGLKPGKFMVRLNCLTLKIQIVAVLTICLFDCRYVVGGSKYRLFYSTHQHF